MATGSGAVCPTCNCDVLPGTLFCWQHVADPPRLAEYRQDEGQLLWATARCKVSAERAVAVIVDGRQVIVRDVAELLGQRPASLLIEYTEPGVDADQIFRADVSLATLLEGFVAGLEFVHATRSSATA
jgi:hypothetical protein